MKPYVRARALSTAGLVALATSALACSKATPGAPGSAGGASPEAGGPPAPSHVAASPDAAREAPPRTASAPNLLAVVPSSVAVSSTVVNPRDFPEHLLDGDPGTAWNSRTGDLRGFVAFRVPKDAHVERIEITAGYDRRRPDLDLFTANHRITRVAVSRDGAKILEAALDPEQRGLQPIAVNGPGGDYRIDVLETLPGSKAAWKELVVSELKVVGTPGKERRAGHEPLRVVTGSLDTPAPSFAFQDAFGATEGSAADVAAACAAFVAAQASAKPVFETDPPLEPKEPTCAEVPLPFAFAPSGAFRSVHVVARQTRFQGRGRALVVETPRGFFTSPFTWGVRDDPSDPGCPSIVREEDVEAVRVDNGQLVVVYAGTRGTWVDTRNAPGDDGYREVLVRGAYWGRLDGAGALTFRHWNPQYQEALGHKTQPDGRRDKRVPWSALPWVDERPFHVDRAGALRIQG